MSPHLALRNLRSCVILLVVSFHSVLPYLAFNPASAAPFDSAPYQWLGIPLIDNERWFGFDLFCAFQYVFLMPFMFFLSGLFVWPSLSRKGTARFLYDRILRLGLPFAFGVLCLMPLAHYPVYRVSAADPSWTAFWVHWRALPFRPNGPLWFLWQLLALNIAAALLRQALPRSGDLLGRLSADSDRFPGRYFTILLALSTAAYLPFALKYRPWDWSEIGPFSFQSGRVLHYVVYFFAGAGVGVYGLDRGLLRADGMLARHWRRWLAGAIGAFIVWMLTTALTLERPDIVFQIAAETAFAVSSATACFCFAAVFLRFANRKWPKFFEALSNNSYGIYLVHYVFVIWLQYLLLGTAIFAIIKGLLVFGSALALSWAVVAAFSRIAQLGGARREKSHGVA